MFGNADLGYINLYGSGPARSKGATPAKKTGGFVDGMLFWWGIVFPAAALLLESNTHMCARQFFDPLPTSGHTLLFALIPVTNFFAWASLRWDMSPHYAFMLFCNGMAVGVAILYTLMFLPITHISCLGILYFGIGVLGLAPLLSLISLLKGGSMLAKSAQPVTYFNAHHVKHLGHLLVLTLVVAVELPSTFTRVALGMAEKPETRQQGLDLLRAFGSQEVMLRACYERSGRATDIVGSLYESHDPLPVAAARDLFYKVTGRTFNSFPIPESARATMRNTGFLVDDGISGVVEDEFDLDPDIAGEMVSGVSRGLSVSKSEMQGKVDPDAAIAKFDWYLNFKNKSKYDREVRTRIKLPHGGVVNQASLIVDGKEYEATITVRSLAREIYRAAVAQKKNPLLVSTAGTDVVLVQVFPVPPSNAREVKLHLGVVAPMELDRQKQGVVVLPQFEERNFQLSAPHNVSLSSPREMKADFQDLQIGRSGESYTLTGSIDPSKLASGNGIIHASRDVSATSFIGTDTWAGGNETATERIKEVASEAPKKLVAVIDGSGAMGPYINGIADAFADLPKETELSVFFVRDDKRQYFTGDRTEIINSIKRLPCTGGQVDGLELHEALKECQYGASSVLWIHGAQPVETPYSAMIQSTLKSFTDHVMLYDMQILSGPNQILDGMEAVPSIAKVPHTGKVEDDLKLLFDTWSNKVKGYQIVREPAARPAVEQSISREPAQQRVGDLVYSSFGGAAPAPATQQVSMAGARKTMPNLAQLMAYDRIMKDMQENTYDSKQNAIRLAAQYHIVTPMSSAVLVTEVPELSSLQASPEPKSSLDITRQFSDYFEQPFKKVTEQLYRLNEVEHSRQMSDQETASVRDFREARESSDADSYFARRKCSEGGGSPSSTSMPLSAPAAQPMAPSSPMAGAPTAVPFRAGQRDAVSMDSLAAKEESGEKKNQVFAQMKAEVAGSLDKTTAREDDAPVLSGATNGAISPQSADSTAIGIAGADMGSSVEQNTVAKGMGQGGGSADKDQPGSIVDGALAPLVPESDTYLLIAAAMGVLGAVTLRNRLKTKKA